MPQQASQSVENNFTAGLKTEFTALNFPDNAATDTDNCIYTLTGDVTRRLGFDYELNYQLNAAVRTNKAISTFKWNNVGGDGTTQVIVTQIGGTLYFYGSSSATVASPLSAQLLVSTVPLSNFLVAGSSQDPSQIECQYSDGNGYLLVTHPYLEPFYCTYSGGTITPSAITIQIRDFAGVPEVGVPNNTRPSTLTAEHNYNLINQGWSSAGTYSGNFASQACANGSHTFTTISESSTSITNGDRVTLTYILSGIGSASATGTVTGYVAGTSLTITVTNAYNPAVIPAFNFILITKINAGLITTWNSVTGNYPSNSDIWWNFKNSSDVFDPATTYTNVSAAAGYAPRGHFVLSAFSQLRTTASSVANITDVITTVRPKTCTWFQGRAWFSGVDSSQAATGDAAFTTWTENIYFSQTVQDVTQLGMCYQVNDPTSQDTFGLLPTDGGVIQIQGCGSIYKLFPIQNGMLVFAANGIWFITGNQGIGFTAADYTITKISQVQSVSGCSFVNVQGLPYFWNEEGIYTVAPAQQGLGLTVEPLVVGTIETFYNDIPPKSKMFARGDYDPINYVVTWVFSSAVETDVTSRYNFNRCLNFNTYNKAFYPYTIEGSPHIHGINYVSNPGTTSAPDPTFKYMTSRNGQITFAEERNSTEYVDFFSVDSVGVDYSSYFVTGYKLRGQATRRFQPQYIYMYSRTDEAPIAYTLQGLWDFASSGNSGRWSSVQSFLIDDQYSSMVVKRHRIRGQGLALQLKVNSVSGYPFDIMGWAISEFANAGA